MSYHELLFMKVVDGDEHIKHEGIQYSTDLRAVITVGDMLENYKD